jgi:hypothetical protein
MTLQIPSFGPSWLPKLGAVFSLLGLIGGYMSDTLPGANYLKPWLLFFGALAVPIIGFTTRQNNVPSSAVPSAVAKQAAPTQPPPTKP